MKLYSFQPLYFIYCIEEYVPKEFWVNSVEPQLFQALEDFNKHKENIDITLFLDDFMRCFMGMAMSGHTSEKLWEAVGEVITENIQGKYKH